MDPNTILNLNLNHAQYYTSSSAMATSSQSMHHGGQPQYYLAAPHTQQIQHTHIQDKPNAVSLLFWNLNPLNQINLYPFVRVYFFNINYIISFYYFLTEIFFPYI